MKNLSKLCCIFMLASFCSVAQTTVVVPPGGSIQSAVNAASPGTTIQVSAGTYAQKVVFSSKSGSSGSFITLKADPGVILNGTGLTPNGREGLITVKNSNYVRIEGFDIQNFVTSGGQTPCGILVEGSGSNVQIFNNKIHNIRNNSTCKDPCGEGAHGLAVFGTTTTGITDILIQGNEIYSNVLQASESMVINGNVDRFEISNNNVHDNNNIGFDFIGYEGECSGCGANDRVRNGLVRGNIAKNNSSTTNPWYSNQGSAGGFYVDGGQYIVFDRNISTGNDLGFEFASEHSGKATEDILMINNVVYNNKDVGVALGGYASGLGEARRIAINNNSFYKNKGFGTEVTMQYKVINCTFTNNIFFGETTASEAYESIGTGSTGNVWGKNIWWGTSTASSGLPGTLLLQNPLYTSPTTGNLTIPSNSPAVNVGITSADITAWTSTFWDVIFPPAGNIPANGFFDNSNQPRVENTIDIGADEFNGGTVTIPNAPTALVATANSASQITLTWADNATNETGFIVERSLSSTTGFAQIATLGSNVTSYQNTGLTAATTYYYRIAANNTAGNSGYSNTANATTNSVVTIPTAPTALVATANSASQITLTWADNATNETGFIVERSLSSTTGFAQIATVGSNATSYVNTGLNAATTYYYRVTATNTAGSSAYSNTANATTNSVVTIPTAPTSLLATVNSASQITLTWADNATNETGFIVERSLSSTTGFAQIATVGSNATSYVNTGLNAATTYYYRVTATNTAGSSAYSNTANATTNSVVTIPTAPTSLLATVNSASQITLTWADNATNETGFIVERSLSSTTGFAQIATVGSNATSYVNTGLNAATTYYYRVTATNTAGSSAYSNTANATTNNPVVTIPNAPTSLLATVNSASQITLTWADNATNETGFIVERSLSSTTGFAQIATLGSNVTSYQNTGLTAGTTYYYRVAATNTAGSSAYSNTANATTNSGGTTTITIDGNTADWSAIPTISTNGLGGLTSLKAYSDATYLYILAQGTTSTNYVVFINSDNLSTTGYTAGLWNPEGSDYSLENGRLYKYTGTGSNWNWTATGVTQTGISAVKNTSVLEIRIPKASMLGLATSIKLGLDIENSSWTTIATIPSEGGAMAPYSFSNARIAALEFVSEDVSNQEVFPNPSNGNSTFHFTIGENDTNVEVSIYNQSGNKVMQFTPDQSSLGEKEIALHLENFSNGIYVIRLRKGNQITNTRLLLQK